MKKVIWSLVLVMGCWGMLWGQEGLDERLFGVWQQEEEEALTEGVKGVLRLELFADGKVEIGFDGIFNLLALGAGGEDGGEEGESEEGEEEEFDPDLLGLIPSLAEDIVVKLSGKGTWQADGETASLVLDETDLLFNGQGAATFFEALGREIAATLAESLGIPAEEREAFEAEIIASFTEGFSEEDLEADFLGEDLGGAYRIEGDVLVLIDEEGIEPDTRLRRVAVSAVLPLGWGAVKQGVR